MLDSASQWNLLADCAKDWGFSSSISEEKQEQAYGATSTEKPDNATFSLQDIASSWQEELTSEEVACSLVHVANLSSDEEKKLVHNLVANPKNATLWQLCLMGYSKENLSKFEQSLENPLEGIEAWLLEGIKKGWLRKQEKSYNIPVVEYPLFIHRLQCCCQNFAHCFTLAVVKTSTEDVVSDTFFQSLANALSHEDFVCEIKGLGYALVLSGRKNFSASALMEKIVERFERKLHTLALDVQCSVGLAEFCQGETADSMLDHAKQALSMPSPIGIRVKSYIQHNQSKKEEHSSLVQCNEKRFLFFGVQ